MRSSLIRIFPSRLTILSVLCLIAVLPYLRLSGADFAYDDREYVVENTQVRSGLSAAGFHWAFTSFERANWHPLSWLSHMTDVSLFGLRPGRHHVVNVLIHGGNTLLLFLLLQKIAGVLWRPFLIAALFAAHPLHVESVAWISERKDLLSTFFFLLTLFAYLRYLNRPGVGRYLAIIGSFSLALLSKPMVVTLPFVLLLLDYWPLGRARGDTAKPYRPPLRKLSFLLLEKAPLLVLSAASSTVTYLAQQRGEALATLETYSVVIRLENAVVSYVKYLLNAAWPHELSVFYRHLGTSIQATHLAVAALSLLAITGITIAFGRRRPYFSVGWFWFIGMLVPVIGIVQLGTQAMADRYTYIPLTGLFLIVVWGGADLARHFRIPRRGCALLAAGIVTLLMTLTWRQAGYWQDDLTLFTRAVELDPDNGLARNNLGVNLMEKGLLREAHVQFSEAVRVSPGYHDALNNLGLVLVGLHRPQEAIPVLQRAIRNTPRAPQAHLNLGLAYYLLRDRKAAFDSYSTLLTIDPAQAAKLLQLLKTL